MIVKYRDGELSKTPGLAKNWRWSNCDSDADIVAYKIVEKHIGPSPMELAEIPVGVLFATSPEKPESVWIKTNDNTFILIHSNNQTPYLGFPFLLENYAGYYETKIKVGG